MEDKCFTVTIDRFLFLDISRIQVKKSVSLGFPILTSISFIQSVGVSSRVGKLMSGRYT